MAKNLVAYMRTVLRDPPWVEEQVESSRGCMTYCQVMGTFIDFNDQKALDDRELQKSWKAAEAEYKVSTVIGDVCASQY